MKKLISPMRAREIFEEALEILENHGLECPDASVCRKIQEKVPCVFKDQHIRFSKEKVRDFFEMRRPRLAASQNRDEEKITIGGNWHAWYFCDPVTNEPRTATREEAIAMARLAESLGAGRGPIPVAPGEISPALHTMECERLALCYTEGMGGCLTATDPEEIAVLKEMYRVANRRYLLALEPLISPLRLNPEVMNIYFQWCDDPELDITIFTPIPMAGATAPLVFPAALVQTLAEGLAQDYLFYQLSNGKNQDGFQLRLDPFDMRHTNIAFGTPEWCLFKQAVVELWNELTGGSYRFGSFRTNSRRVDAQAMMERTASFLWQMEMGMRHFSAVGQMSVDEVFSPVQAMLDAELAGYGNRLLKGFDGIWLDTSETKAILEEGLKSHNFMDSESTLEYFRETYDMTRLSDERNVMAWKEAGMPCFEKTAWEMAQDRIRTHTFELEDAKQNKINDLFRLYAKSVKKI
ncbi:MAG: trimethylamine methyltransferase family protein [Fusicatenibacter sp.]|nr:trimethylamine methyltransferase family protein [Fusicatenibacter sp.]